MPQHKVPVAIALARASPLQARQRRCEQRRCRRGAGYPTRLVELAQGLEGRALLSSLCDIREARMVRGIAERIAHAACAD